MANYPQLRALRLERGWSQRELAQRVGLSVDTVRRAEQGDWTVRVGTLGILLAAFGKKLVPVAVDINKVGSDFEARSGEG